MGSSAEHVLRYASVPVLLVRAPEAATQAEAAATATATHVSLPTGALAFE
jgi:hypothetical protein